MKDAAKSIRVHTQRVLEQEHARFKQSSQLFKHVTQRYLGETHHTLLRYGRDLENAVLSALQQRKNRVNRLEQQTVSSSKYLLQQHYSFLEKSVLQLPIHGKAVLRNAQNDLEKLEQSVRLMDPQNVLQRGYSITTYNNKTVNSINDIEIGDEVQTRTATFTLTSKVTAKTDKHE